MIDESPSVIDPHYNYSELMGSIEQLHLQNTWKDAHQKYASAHVHNRCGETKLHEKVSFLIYYLSAGL